MIRANTLISPWADAAHPRLLRENSVPVFGWVPSRLDGADVFERWRLSDAKALKIRSTLNKMLVYLTPRRFPSLRVRRTPMEDVTDNRIVLLVEDSDDDAFFFERAFEMAQTRAQLVRMIDGREVVSYLERVSAESSDSLRNHLIFLDLKLPVLSGFDVLRWIRQQGLSVEVVVLSGSDLETDISSATNLGAADYLAKPISVAEIKRRVGQSVKSNDG